MLLLDQTFYSSSKGYCNVSFNFTRILMKYKAQKCKIITTNEKNPKRVNIKIFTESCIILFNYSVGSFV